MEMIDFNPHVIRRRLSTEPVVRAKKRSKLESILAPGNNETVAHDRKDKDGPDATTQLGHRKVTPTDNIPNATPDPEHGGQEGQSRIVNYGPLQFPSWIPMEAALNCGLPYTTYQVPIPSDLNMDFCIDVMMGQDTIVFMFVCHILVTLYRSKLIFAELQDNEAGDEYTWSILSF